MLYRLAADALLVLHWAFVAFVVVGLVLTLLGGALKWRWVRSPGFRFAHLACIVFVAGQAWLGRICPLTIWENQLRRAAGEETYPGSFIAYWLDELLYFDAPMWVFAVCYSAFAVLVGLSFVLVPVRRDWRDGRRGADATPGGHDRSP